MLGCLFSVLILLFTSWHELFLSVHVYFLNPTYFPENEREMSKMAFGNVSLPSGSLAMNACRIHALCLRRFKHWQFVSLLIDIFYCWIFQSEDVEIHHLILWKNKSSPLVSLLFIFFFDFFSFDCFSSHNYLEILPKKKKNKSGALDNN